jgi:RNase P/RNase MRP subunit POP5
MRRPKRYVLIQLQTTTELTGYRDEFTNVLEQKLGAVNAVKAELHVPKTYRDTQSLILRVDNELKQHVLATLAYIDTLNGVKTTFNPLTTSGVIDRVKTYHDEHREALRNQKHVPA